MKIRTDFVTNSSATCTTEIIIDNPVLLEILQRYKDMGTFGDGLFFGIGGYDYIEYVFNFNPMNPEDVVYEKVWYSNLTPPQETKKPAFYFYENLNGEGWPRGGRCPEKLDDVLTNLLDLMSVEQEKYNKDLYVKLEKEVQDRKNQINAEYMYVQWNNRGDEDEPWPGGILSAEYSYSPATGEKYQEEYFPDDDIHGNDSGKDESVD